MQGAGGSGSNPFGRPPMAGGIGASKQVTPDPRTPEQKQVFEVKWQRILNKYRFEDLHDDGRNVAEMSREEHLDVICLSLENVRAEIAGEENNVIAEQLQALQ